MLESQSKNLSDPDDTLRFPGVVVAQVSLGDVTVGRAVHEPGWRWSTHMRPTVGGEWCEARHVGVVLAGRLGIQIRDGSTFEFGPDDVYEIQPGHDGYVIGHEPCHMIEWSGLRAFAGFRAGGHGRALVSLLFTDVVESTATVKRVGDVAWRELLSEHLEAARDELVQHRGREIATTGDGILAVFDGPAQALSCAAAIRTSALRSGIDIRAAVHVGEVEMVGGDVRGVAVHEATRIMGHAAPNEILVSDITRSLASAGGLTFEARGSHELKGLPDEYSLFAYIAGDGSAPA